jgi:general secretion pathway protein F
MMTFRYQALQENGSAVTGVIEAEDRRGALRLLGERRLFPSTLETCAAPAGIPAAMPGSRTAGGQGIALGPLGARVRRKDITAFTREMAALLQAGISIPQGLEGLAEEEENAVFSDVLRTISDSVRKGASLSSALEEHPRLFTTLYVSMVRVGEEAGALQQVMADLAGLLEHEDEVRGEIVAAVSYPLFVLGFGLVTVVVLLTFVLPGIFAMLSEMTDILPFPTRVLLGFSGLVQEQWVWLFLGTAGAAYGLRRFLKSPGGARFWDQLRLRIPFLGPVFRSAALGRFARTLGTLTRSGVSLLPSLKIVENTIGNRMLAEVIARVTEETRGGDSLAGPLRKLGVFPRTAVQMISVGEETGKLDQMLLRVAEIEERHMRTQTKTLISLVAPVLILVVGALVGFVVIAILLPILDMSRNLR